MNMIMRLFLSSLVFAAILAAPIHAANSAGVPVTVVVTVVGGKNAPPPAIEQGDVNVYSGQSRLNVTSWTPATGAHSDMQLAILINSADGPVADGNELRELAEFIESQPKTTAVGLFYGVGETIDTASPFSTDHAAVAKALHLTLGPAIANSPSIYLSLRSLIQKWPAQATRREVLLVASGFDPLDSGLLDPYLDSTMDSAQKASIEVYTLYSGGARLGETFDGGIAQSNLRKLSGQSGGADLYTGILTPVSFGPYLDNLNGLLSNQYLLTFSAPPSKAPRGALRSIRVHLEDHRVKVLYPQQVLVPGS